MKLTRFVFAAAYDGSMILDDVEALDIEQATVEALLIARARHRLECDAMDIESELDGFYIRLADVPVIPEPSEGPAGFVVDLLNANPEVLRAETFDRAESGYYVLRDGRAFNFSVEQQDHDSGGGD